MAVYRVLHLDKHDSVTRFTPFVAANDQDAIRQGPTMARSKTIEIWHGAKMVARVPLLRSAAGVYVIPESLAG
ncbi:MAG: hypothetical protein JO127_07250 [Caulobacteraceae bacterium]|nr:hypothetical protein [Caulobacteraceae bacterium]